MVLHFGMKLKHQTLIIMILSIVSSQSLSTDLSKMQEDKVDAEVPDIDALIKENTSDEFIEKKINDVLGDNVELKEE